MTFMASSIAGLLSSGGLSHEGYISFAENTEALRVMCLTAEDAIISTKLIVVQSWADVLWSFINNSIGFIGAAETIARKLHTN